MCQGFKINIKIPHCQVFNHWICGMPFLTVEKIQDNIFESSGRPSPTVVEFILYNGKTIEGLDYNTLFWKRIVYKSSYNNKAH